MPDWTPNQRVARNRARIVTIDRVTKSGRAIIGDVTFDPNGIERSSGNPYRRDRIEPLTPEIEAEIMLRIRGQRALMEIRDALGAAETWSRNMSAVWHKGVLSIEEVNRAERLAAAIRSILEEK
jgi:hypothetical protein